MRALVIAALVFVFFAAAGTARAVTLEEIVALSKAGLSDAVIIDLVEIDGSRFELDAARIIELRRAGVSNRVIRALLKTMSRPDEAEMAADDTPALDTANAGAPIVINPPAPQVVVVQQPAPAPEPEVVTVPVYVPVAVHHHRPHHPRPPADVVHRSGTIGVSVNDIAKGFAGRPSGGATAPQPGFDPAGGRR